MFTRASWLHLRIPFSWFLLPVFLFSLCVSPNFNGPRIGWVFLIVHLLLYPASNGYNSYFDKDEKSIGGLKHPPPVNQGLYFLAIAFDLLAIVLGFIYINTTFAVMLTIYGLVSKAYSHPAVRIKKYAVTSWLIAGLFQGLFTFVMCYVGLNDFPLETVLQPRVLMAGGLTTLMLWANYPLTQVYQHEEDSKRGDRTLSISLGIEGTFLFTAGVFTLAVPAFFLYLLKYFQPTHAYLFPLTMAPVLIYFIYWYVLVRRDNTRANYERTMLLNLIASTCLNGYFVYLFLDSSQVLQVL